MKPTSETFQKPTDEAKDKWLIGFIRLVVWRTRRWMHWLGWHDAYCRKFIRTDGYVIIETDKPLKNSERICTVTHLPVRMR